MKMKKLYRVISVLGNFPYGGKRNEESIVYWTFSNRAKSLIAYDLAIENYESIPEVERELQERAVDELFTREEALALKAYLKGKYRWDKGVSQDECVIEKVSLPIPADALPLSALGYGEFELNRRKKNNSLPFKVSGYCQVYSSRSSKSIDDSGYEMQGGLKYIRSALKHLKVKTAYTDDEIKRVVAIISGEGWVVHNCLSRAQIEAILQERLNGGPLHRIPGISLASLEELENRRWSHKEIKPRRFTYSRSAFTFSTIAHPLEFPDRILPHRNQKVGDSGGVNVVIYGSFKSY
jgi:hypothetical protein